MQIDRVGFLFLTSSLFAACNETARAVETPIEVPLQPAPPPTAPIARVDAGVFDRAPVAQADESGEEPYAPWPGTADPPLASSVHAQACDKADNAKGSPGPCSLKRMPGPTCESFGDTVKECAAYRSWLVPRVAEKSVACLRTKSGTDGLCLFNIGVSCVIESLSNVCLDDSPKNTTACTKVMTACDAVEKKDRHMTIDSCKASLSAIVPGRHAKFLHCAAESCDLVPCMYAAAN